VRIAVYGGRGRIGAAIVREALSRGHQVTVVARKTNSSPDGDDPPRVVRGDVLDAASVIEVARDHDVLVSAVGASPHSPDPDPTIYRRAADTLTAALRRLKRPPRLLAVGGAGSLEVEPEHRLVDSPGFPEIYRDEARGQSAALDHYRSVSDVAWTYVSPAAVVEPGSRTGRYRRGNDRLLVDDNGHSRISIEDYAAAVIDEAEQGTALGRRITVAY
jgi:uncharacterized protein